MDARSGRPSRRILPSPGSLAIRRPPALEESRRLWEVDAVRGVAMIMVALYHLMYDLDLFGGYAIESTSGFWGLFADTSAFVFVFLVGLSLSLSHSRAGGAAVGALFGKYLGRGLRIFGYGMLITFVFWALDLGAVIFGILHLIGLSIVLAYPFMRLRLLNAVLGLLVIALGAYVQALGVSAGGITGVLLAPWGVVPEDLGTMPDYRPLLPWFGVVLLGLSAGNLLYRSGRVGTARRGPGPAYARPLAFVGRHTLLIYLVHQPVLIVVLAALGVIRL